MEVVSTTDGRQKRIDDLLRKERQGRRAARTAIVLVGAAILSCFWVTGMFDGERIADGLPAIGGAVLLASAVAIS